MKVISYIVFIFFIVLPGFGQQIVIDGQTDEWTDAQLVATDLEVGNQLDIERLYAHYDEQYLYLRIDVSQEIILQRESELVLAIDSDDDNSTGFPIKGLGTEFSFYFTGNNGFVNPDNGSISIFHSDVGFFVAPAFESTTFEIAIDRNLGFYGPSLDNTINVAIFNNISGGDILPNSGGVSINLAEEIENEFPQVEYDKPDAADFRLLSFNTQFDQIFETASYGAYQRIFQSTKPDIIAFQEIYDHSSSETAELVESMVPLQNNEQWYHEQVGADIILLSKYPILFDDWVSGNGAFVLDVDGQEVLIINVHLPCCDNDQGRDEEIDGILRYLRNLMNGSGPYELEANSPYFIIGDFNLVGGGDQLERLLTGDIKNNVIFGNDFQPNWFNGDLVDAAPVIPNSNLAYTWYNEFSSYTGGRLDYVLHTPESIFEVNKYVIDTRIMGQSDLFLSGLSQSDSEDASDHLALVTDWSFNPLLSNQNINLDHTVDIYPLPFDERLNVRVKGDKKMTGIFIYSASGQLVQRFDSIYASNFTISSSDLHSGFYYCEILFENGSKSIFPITK